MKDKPIWKPEESPAAWFAVLERARGKGDRDLEARALRELRRLGVSVSFNGGEMTNGGKGVSRE